MSAGTAPASTTGGRFIAGDPLRGGAVLMIVVVHCAYAVFWELIFRGGDPVITGIYTDPGIRFLDGLALSVNIFFVLSGYLIAGPFVRSIAEGSRLPRIGAYLRNRALRIVPAFWVVFTVLLVIYGAKGTTGPQILMTYGFAQTLTTAPAAIFLMPQGWTVGVEVGFYLTIPVVSLMLAWLVGRRLERRRRLRVVGVLLLVVFALSIWLRDIVLTPTLFAAGWSGYPLTFPFWLWAFIPGVALAALEAGSGREWARRPTARHVPGALLVVAAAAFLGYVVFDGKPPTSVRDVGSKLLLAISSAAVVAAPLIRQWAGRPTWGLFASPVLAWVGERSYSIYLIHFGVIFTLQSEAVSWMPGPRWSFAFLLVTAIPITIALAHLSYTYIEKPFLERKRPWRRAVKAPPTVGEAAGS